MNQSDLEKVAARFPLSEATKRRNQAGGVPENAERQRDIVDEPVGTNAREVANQGRRLVRFKAYRVRLCDVRNLWDKHFTDALTEAGILVDDSPAHCKVEEIEQIKVHCKAFERTEIEITDLVEEQV